MLSLWKTKEYTNGNIKTTKMKDTSKKNVWNNENNPEISETYLRKIRLIWIQKRYIWKEFIKILLFMTTTDMHQHSVI